MVSGMQWRLNPSGKTGSSHLLGSGLEVLNTSVYYFILSFRLSQQGIT